MTDSYVIAIYQVDQAYGGPEEGGWWFDAGDLLKAVEVCPNEDLAYERCREWNRLLHAIINSKRPCYYHTNSEGRVSAMVFKNFAPKYFPEVRPHYE